LWEKRSEENVPRSEASARIPEEIDLAHWGDELCQLCVENREGPFRDGWGK